MKESIILFFALYLTVTYVIVNINNALNKKEASNFGLVLLLIACGLWSYFYYLTQ